MTSQTSPAVGDTEALDDLREQAEERAYSLCASAGGLYPGKVKVTRRDVSRAKLRHHDATEKDLVELLAKAALIRAIEATKRATLAARDRSRPALALGGPLRRRLAPARHGGQERRPGCAGPRRTARRTQRKTSSRAGPGGEPPGGDEPGPDPWRLTRSTSPSPPGEIRAAA